uniref:Uncharacterized protein n=1 Tax=Xiphophorus couchianus TaxID=32473 RepID=A0A3B5M7W3_9TELE
MGVPSVKREVHSYLTDTLSSLMSELSPAEKDDCVVVVLIAEVLTAKLPKYGKNYNKTYRTRERQTFNSTQKHVIPKLN